MKRSLFALALAGVLLLSGSPSHAQQEIIFGITANPGSLQQVTAAEFVRRANERLGDLAQVVLFDAGQLGNDKELLQKLKIGSVHIALPSSIMSSISGSYGIFDMPFIIKDREHLSRVEEAVFWPTLAPALERNGYKVLGLWENGIRHVTNDVRPIVVPSDLEGLKIRTPRSTWRIKMFSEWGANPTPMSFSEVFVALQTGVIDGQENPLTNIHAAKFQEVQQYLSMTGHVYTPAYPTVGLAAWNRFGTEITSVLEEIARDVQGFAREKGAADDQALLASLTEAGIQVNDADRAAFVTASTPIYEQFAVEVDGGQEMIDRVLSLAE